MKQERKTATNEQKFVKLWSKVSEPRGTDLIYLRRMVIFVLENPDIIEEKSLMTLYANVSKLDPDTPEKEYGRLSPRRVEKILRNTINSLWEMRGEERILELLSEFSEKPSSYDFLKSMARQVAKLDE